MNNISKRHVPERSCSVCHNKYDKSELIRIVRTPNGEFIIDSTGKAQGRGAYICKSRECIEKCIKKRALNKSFKTNVPDELYATIGRIAEEN